MNSVSWDYYDRFEDTINKYMPERGEGETLASQVVTAVNKLVYKWYNDGDVYDNTAYMEGWWNDLSSYANWLHNHTEADRILGEIFDCGGDDEYESILKRVADMLLDEEYLEGISKAEKQGSIYECSGPFRYKEQDEDEEDW